MNNEPIKILADIIQTRLSLTDQQIWIYNQDFKMPETSGLFIVLEQIDSTPYANNNRAVDDGGTGMNEEINLQKIEQYAINIFSKDSSARMRKEEVMMALSSTYAQQQQEVEQFRIGKIQEGFINASEIEGAGMLTRFILNVTLFTWYIQNNSIDFYETFSNNIEIDNP